MKFKRLVPATVAKLSWKGSRDVEAIFLYNDGCVPTVNAKNMEKYLERLNLLAKLKFADDD